MATNPIILAEKEIDQERWQTVLERGLKHGAHTSPSRGMCALSEQVSA